MNGMSIFVQKEERRERELANSKNHIPLHLPPSAHAYTIVWPVTFPSDNVLVEPGLMIFWFRSAPREGKCVAQWIIYIRPTIFFMVIILWLCCCYYSYCYCRCFMQQLDSHPDSLLSLTIMMSLFGQLALVVIFQVASLSYAQHQSWFQRLNPDPEGTNIVSYENTASR